MSSRNVKQSTPRGSFNIQTGIILLMMTFGMFLAGRGLWSTKQQQQATQEALIQAKEDYQLAQQRHHELLEERQLVHDPDYLEEIARRDYFYSKPGEILFHFEEAEFNQQQDFKEDNN